MDRNARLSHRTDQRSAFANRGTPLWDSLIASISPAPRDEAWTTLAPRGEPSEGRGMFDYELPG
jgi:hypothetical protein